MIKRYALINNEGLVDNVVLWNGVPYTPSEEYPEGGGWDVPSGLKTILLEDDSPVQIGDLIDDDGTVIETVQPDTDGH